MKKDELMQQISEQCDISKAETNRIFDTTIDVIVNAINNHGEIKIPKLGTFSKKERAERDGRNPRTGEVIRISARQNITFKPAESLKKMINE